MATQTGLGAEVGEEGGIGHEHHQTIEATIARIEPSRQQQTGRGQRAIRNPAHQQTFTAISLVPQKETGLRDILRHRTARRQQPARIVSHAGRPQTKRRPHAAAQPSFQQLRLVQFFPVILQTEGSLIGLLERMAQLAGIGFRQSSRLLPGAVEQLGFFVIQAQQGDFPEQRYQA
ncbi:MAG TPA: hypothetical protein VF797_12710 [Noviherbaspirillum sp.]